jgi:hypothetical protein
LPQIIAPSELLYACTKSKSHRLILLKGKLAPKFSEMKKTWQSTKAELLMEAEEEENK